jgi:hypothetical protein
MKRKSQSMPFIIHMYRPAGRNNLALMRAVSLQFDAWHSSRQKFHADLSVLDAWSLSRLRMSPELIQTYSSERSKRCQADAQGLRLFVHIANVWRTCLNQGHRFHHPKLCSTTLERILE